jgi:acetyl-CoA carboxylase carboxyl transferase subunit beta
MWMKCSYCHEIIFRQELVKNFHVCPKCNYHFRISSADRIALLVDEGSFVSYGEELTTADPLSFRDSKKYRDRIRDSKHRSGGTESLQAGEGTINGRPFQLCVFDFSFMGGSMGRLPARGSPAPLKGRSTRPPPWLLPAVPAGRACRRASFPSCRWPRHRQP